MFFCFITFTAESMLLFLNDASNKVLASPANHWLRWECKRSFMMLKNSQHRLDNVKHVDGSRKYRFPIGRGVERGGVYYTAKTSTTWQETRSPVYLALFAVCLLLRLKKGYGRRDTGAVSKR